MVKWGNRYSLRAVIAIPTKSGEAIPSKAATDVRNSSFSNNHPPTGHDFSCQWANKNFNSIIHQVYVANWAPFRIENPEHRDASSGREVDGLK